MRYEPEHKTQTRDRIVRNTARKLRAEGLNGPGVASVMKSIGPDRGRLLQALSAARTSFSPKPLHRHSRTARRSIPPCKTCRVRTGGRRSFGCTFHLSTAIIPTRAARLRRWRRRLLAPNLLSGNEFPGLMKERAERWVEFMPGATAPERERNFFVIFSAMAGAVSIGRLLTEPADRQKVLASMRDHLLHSF